MSNKTRNLTKKILAAQVKDLVSHYDDSLSDMSSLNK